MIYADCEMCERREGIGQAVGLTCDCGQHFHIGAVVAVRGASLQCPRCAKPFNPVDLRGHSNSFVETAAPSADDFERDGMLRGASAYS